MQVLTSEGWAEIATDCDLANHGCSCCDASSETLVSIGRSLYWAVCGGCAENVGGEIAAGQHDQALGR